ncbi:ABC transporter ATP-binding protein [Leuconostoc suionicum]|uniref:ABC transporter ATP-binding protein n=1 Tax=Leuconostoc suionicum TaxID=1511761 RepID=UPI00233F68D2|nr:ABC transporter ATP-binding protein [Leuconostoc suionicum]MDC2805179.1 ABC transporter ATP-binding protein [Leuconostoc suionicum]MDC2822691.1 ABC transporter ATP-binding protein [Leuconostoc suionicum]
MIEKISKKFVLSKKGARNYLVSSLLEFINNILAMLPMMLFIVFLLEWEKANYLFTSPVIVILLVFVIITILYVSNYFDYTFLFVSAYKESEKNRIRLINKMKELPASYYSKHSTAELTNVLLNDISEQEKLFSGAMPKMIGMFLFMALGFVSMSIYNFWMAVTLFSTYPMSAFIFWLSGRIEKRAHEKYDKQLLKQSNVFQEFIEKMPEVRFFNFVHGAKKEIFSLLEQQEKSHLQTELPTAIFHGLITSVTQINLVLLIIFGGFWWETGNISLITFLVFILVATRFNGSMVGIFETLSQYRYVKLCMNRLRKIYDTQPDSANLQPDLKHYNFTVSDLHFGYAKKDEILKGISCQIPEKKVTAIVGPSGSGKSTFLRLLSKFYPYDSGKILLDGVDIKTIEPNFLFKQISMVFQEVILFNNSIQENIRVGNPNATDEQVIEAGKLAQCDEFTEHLANGYDTNIGENGSQLSGGQRQRIAIARAILKDSPILFLDEISSGLDYENEYYVQKALSNLVENRTVIVVAHRLKTIETADNILVIDNGYLKECGNKSELLSKNGVFSKLWKLENNIESNGELD